MLLSHKTYNLENDLHHQRYDLHQLSYSQEVSVEIGMCYDWILSSNLVHRPLQNFLKL